MIMATHTLTFALGGRVEIGQFQEGITRFQRLVTALTPKQGVKWVIEDLQSGSATVTLVAETETPNKAAQVVADFDNIGKALSNHEPLPDTYSKRVRQAALGIQGLAGIVESVRFETADSDHIVAKNGAVAPPRSLKVSVGAITGRVQTLTNRGGLRFTLYDHIHDKAVSCYLQPGREDWIREAWGRRARVSGTVSRDGVGLPVAVRQVLNIEPLAEPTPGSYQQARGALAGLPGDEKPETVIRRLRDG